MAATPTPPPTAAALQQRVDALTRHLVRVQTERMAGVPLLNPALCVEVVGFGWVAQAKADTDAAATPVAEGVLITPWFMSLVRLPLAVLPHGNRVGRSAVRQFGCERFDFIGAHDAAIGFHETCALFSPMDGFTSQALARETAWAALALVRPAATAPTSPVARLDPSTQTHPATPAQAVPPMPARRSFLWGARPRQGAAT